MSGTAKHTKGDWSEVRELGKGIPGHRDSRFKGPEVTEGPEEL